MYWISNLMEGNVDNVQSLDTILSNIKVGNSIQISFSHSNWPPN